MQALQQRLSKRRTAGEDDFRFQKNGSLDVVYSRYITMFNAVKQPVSENLAQSPV